MYIYSADFNKPLNNLWISSKEYYAHIKVHNVQIPSFPKSLTCQAHFCQQLFHLIRKPFVSLFPYELILMLRISIFQGLLYL